MSQDIETKNSALIDSTEQLVDFFRCAEKEVGSCVVGTETERIPFRLDTLAPLDYDDGIRLILQGLCAYGWAPEPNEECPLALRKGNASVTLEPGGQLELAGAPLKSIHETAREMTAYSSELLAVSEPLGFGIHTLGNRPFASVQQVHWMPRQRYQAMRHYLGQRGQKALPMMLLSATVQANYDFCSEADMARKMRVAMGISPTVAALFANSPYSEGKWGGLRTERYAMWLRVDSDRCGLLPCVFDDDFGYQAYLDYALDVPMMFVVRDGEFVSASGRTFRQYLREGHEGQRATIADFELHLSTLFPEVRLKRFIEVRSADAGTPEMAVALSALWKGILYDDEAMSQIDGLFESFAFEDLLHMQRAAAQYALTGHGRHWHLRELAAEIVSIADAGLKRQGCCLGSVDESIYLAPLFNILRHGQTLADQMLTRFGAGPLDSEARFKLVAEASLKPMALVEG